MKNVLKDIAKEIGVTELDIALCIYPKHREQLLNPDSDQKKVKFNAMQSLRLVYRGVVELKSSQIIALSELLQVSTDYILKGE